MKRRLYLSIVVLIVLLLALAGILARLGQASRLVTRRMSEQRIDELALRVFEGGGRITNALRPRNGGARPIEEGEGHV